MTKALPARLVGAALLALPLASLDVSAAGAAYAHGVERDSTNDSAADAGTITASTNETLQLAVIINQRPNGEVGEFLVRGGQLFARADELQKLGFQVPKGIATAGDLIPLDGSPGLSARIDQSTQSLYVTADPQWLQPTLLGPVPAAGGYAIESSPGATLNYDVVGTSADGNTVASGALDFRAFSRLGVLSSGLLFHTGPTFDRQQDALSAVRLDTTYVYSDPNSLRRYRLGDFIQGGLPWTRPIRMGGAQVNLDFSMRPDLITFPVPQISGSAAVPSTVDVLVNNSKVVSGSIAPGPFEVAQVPVMNGSGTVTTTVTDALGRQVVTQMPFYTSPALLSPKLQVYSGELGFARRNWGTLSNDYADFAGSATYRRGISDYLTVEAHGEATKRLVMAGVGAVANLFNFAVANIAVAGSSHSGHSGVQLAAGIERVTPILSFGGSVIVADHHFADLAAVNGTLSRRSSSTSTPDCHCAAGVRSALAIARRSGPCRRYRCSPSHRPTSALPRYRSRCIRSFSLRVIPSSSGERPSSPPPSTTSPRSTKAPPCWLASPFRSVTAPARAPPARWHPAGSRRRPT